MYTGDPPAGHLCQPNPGPRPPASPCMVFEHDAISWQRVQTSWYPDNTSIEASLEYIDFGRYCALACMDMFIKISVYNSHYSIAVDLIAYMKKYVGRPQISFVNVITPEIFTLKSLINKNAGWNFVYFNKQGNLFIYYIKLCKHGKHTFLQLIQIHE